MMQTRLAVLDGEETPFKTVRRPKLFVHVLGEHDVAVAPSDRAPLAQAPIGSRPHDTLPEGELVTPLAGGQLPLDLRLDHASSTVVSTRYQKATARKYSTGLNVVE